MATEFNKATSEGDAAQHAAQHARAELAGTKLVEVVKCTTNHGKLGTRPLFEHEKKTLDDCFRASQASSTFTPYYVEAVRAAISARNEDVLRTLLAKDQTQTVLGSDHDILQLAIFAIYHGYEPYGVQLDQAMLAVARLIVRHGARVDSLDDGGNTPLYYCCLHDYPQTFRFLIDQGAGFSTLHDQVPSRSPPTASSTPRKWNLLHVAASGFCTFYRTMARRNGSNTSDYSRWFSMVTFLVDSGLSLPLDDAAGTSLLTAACHEGELHHVRLLLERGLQFDTDRHLAGDYMNHLAPGLHAAVLQGHHLVVLHLLQNSCRPTWTCTYKDREGEKYRYTAIAAACVSNSDLPPEKRPTGFFLACEAMLDAGASDRDAYLLLEEAAKCDKLDTVRRILDSGVSLEHVPLCAGSPRMAQALVETGAALDREKLQTHAIRCSSLDLLKWLDETYGPSAPPERFGLVLRDASNAVLRYLITEYGRGSQNSGTRHAILTEVLRFAARGSKLEIVDMVLSQDSASGSHHLQQIVSELLRDRFCEQFIRGDDRKDLEMCQLLLLHINPEAGAEYAERPRIWLRPSMLPPELMDRSSAGPDRRLHGQTPLFVGKSESHRHLLPSTRSDRERKVSPLRYKHPAEQYCGDMPLREHIPLPTAPSTISPMHGSEFSYGKIEGPWSIRLLVLQPSKHMQEPIKGILVHADLAQKPSYEALSYVWGNPADKVPISLHDVEFGVTRNLWAALCRFRLPTEPRLLWIDALCINQDDLDERNQQVGIMKDIYKSASRVVIWIGEEADDSHLVFQHLRMWKKYRDDHKAELTMLNDAYHEAHINPPRYYGRTDEAFQELCRRPWFFRTWTIQEKALSRDAVLVCGQDAEDWSLLLRPTFGRIKGALEALNEVHGSTYISNLDELGPNSRVTSIIRHSRLCHATDPKDKVYGLLGLFEHPLIPVDYSISLEAVYTRFTQAVIQQENSLLLLHMFANRERKQPLPSWVPDFSISTPIILLPLVLRGLSYPVNPVSEYMIRTPPCLRFSGSEMSLEGCNIDAVNAVGDELVADVAYAPGKKAFMEVMQKWESLAVRIRQKQFSQSITTAFFNTLRANKKGDPLDTSGYELSKALAWYAEFGTGVLKSFDKTSFTELEVIVEWYKWRRSGTSKHFEAEIYMNDIKNVCYGRCFFITQKGSMGLCLPGAISGDLIVCFPGGRYPFVLRPQREDKFVMVGDCYLHNHSQFDFTMEDIEGFERFTLL